MLWPVVATLSVGALTLGVFLERSVSRDLMASIDDELVRALGAVARPGPSRQPPGPAGEEQTVADEDDDVDVAIQLVVDEAGRPIEERRGAGTFSDEVLSDLAGTVGVHTIEGTPRYRARTAAGRDGTTAITALSLDDFDRSLASLRRNLLIGGLVLVAVEAAVVSLIARIIARPVTRMSEVAHRIAGGELDSDVGAPEGPAETAALAEDLALMLDRLRRTIDERARSAERAERAKRDMERFMADASHELATPLTAIKGYSELYRGGMLDDEGLDRAMGRIGSESERLSRLVAELLELTRDDPVRESVDLAAVTSAVVHDLRAAHPRRTITLDADTDVEAFVEGNPHRLHQAVLNLAANACHHTPSDTPIELVLDTTGPVVTVSVIDHGPGVEPEDAADLFLPFTRGDESRSRRSHDGAGLGLALVHQIAEQHGGSVGVVPTPGGGATFELSIPARDAERQPEPVRVR